MMVMLRQEVEHGKSVVSYERARTGIDAGPSPHALAVEAALPSPLLIRAPIITT